MQPSAPRTVQRPGHCNCGGVIFRYHARSNYSAAADRGGLFRMLHRACSTGPRNARGLMWRACKALSSRVPVHPRCMRCWPDLPAVSTPDFIQDDPPPGPGLCAPVLWLLNLSIWPHDLGRHIREKLLGLPLKRMQIHDTRHPEPDISVDVSYNTPRERSSERCRWFAHGRCCGRLALG